MPWVPPRDKSPFHRLPFHNNFPFQNNGHRQSRKRTVKITLLGFCTLAFWYTFWSTSLPFASQDSTQGVWPQQHILTSINSDTTTESDTFEFLAIQATIGTIHALFGDVNPTYERALDLREAHSTLHNHPMFVLRERILTGLWSKPAWILSIIVQELSKPEKERLSWLMWVDADVVVMNKKIPLEVYLPPSPEFDYLNLLVTHDRHGLNNGVFLIKVNSWSVRMLSAVIAYPSYKPDIELKYTEQSGLEKVIEDPAWAPRVQQVPQWWFNAYPGIAKPVMKIHEFRAGALQIHFASNRDGKRPERMGKWMAIAEEQLPEWNVRFEDTSLPDEMSAFWANVSKTRGGSIENTDEVDTFWDLKEKEKGEERTVENAEEVSIENVDEMKRETSKEVDAETIEDEEQVYNPDQ